VKSSPGNNQKKNEFKSTTVFLKS